MSEIWSKVAVVYLSLFDNPVLVARKKNEQQINEITRGTVSNNSSSR